MMNAIESLTKTARLPKVAVEPKSWEAVLPDFISLRELPGPACTPQDQYDIARASGYRGLHAIPAVCLRLQDEVRLCAFSRPPCNNAALLLLERKTPATRASPHPAGLGPRHEPLSSSRELTSCLIGVAFHVLPLDGRLEDELTWRSLAWRGVTLWTAVV
jgi:hypothetical protein